MVSFKDKTTLNLAKPDRLPSHFSAMLTEGITSKQFLVDQHQQLYLAKQPDPLTVQDVFTGYLPKHAINANDPKQQAHIKSLELESAFIETLMPCIVRHLFKDQIVVPKVYLHIAADNTIHIISKVLPKFDEFLAHKACIKEGKACFDGQLPSRKDLALSTSEAVIVGQLYAVGLIINHWDLLNSKMRNAGKVDASPAIVDFGFCAHLSYKGRHADSLPMDDALFKSEDKIRHNFFGPTYLQHYRYRNALPFDKRVGALPMHTLIEDMYEMAGDDEISQAIRQGFESMIETAQQSLNDNKNLFVDAFNETLDSISNESNIQSPQLLSQLNQSFYTSKPNTHNLFAILEGRLQDCRRILAQAKSGATSLDLQQQARDQYRNSQRPLRC